MALAPDRDVVQVPQGHRVTRKRTVMVQIATAAVPGVTLDQVRGDGEANLGWWSGQLESRVLSWLVRGTARGATPLLMATVICSPEGDVDAVADLRCPRREASSPSHGAPEGASGGRH